MPPRNARISPISIAMIIYAVIFLAFFPPLGLILLAVAFFVQRNYRHSVLADRHAKEAARLRKIEKARAKARAEQLATARRFCR